MELFKENIKINSFITVYIGLEMGFLTKEIIIDSIESDLITSTSEQYTKLILTDNEDDFFKIIKGFVIENSLVKTFDCLDEYSEIDIGLIPYKFWVFWEVEILKRVLLKNNSKQEKLNEVANLHSHFMYNEDWHSFIYYMPAMDDTSIGIDNLYTNLLDYVTFKVKSL